MSVRRAAYLNTRFSRIQAARLSSSEGEAGSSSMSSDAKGFNPWSSRIASSGPSSALSFKILSTWCHDTPRS
jgi:hypothetical protein